MSVFLEADEVARYRNVEETDARGLVRHRLEHAQDGSCIYLDDAGACSIYEQRPRLCRTFDCRPLAYCGIRLKDQDQLNEGLEHWDLTPRSAEEREVLLALDLCRQLFSDYDAQADVAAAMFFSMLEDARPLARAKLKNDPSAASLAENQLVGKWSPRMRDAASRGRIGD
jgi:hypothetical protein